MKDLQLDKSTVTISAAILTALKNAMIIDYGIIKEIPSEGIVTVVCSVAKNRSDAYITNCVLANIASDTMTVHIKPKVGDKVLVLCPRRFNTAMFDKEKDDIIVSKGSVSYSSMGAIAVLLNQYKKADHKNILDLSEGSLDLKLGYDKEQDVNNAEVSITNKGEITVKNNKTSVVIADTGDITLSVNSKTTISIKADTGDVSIDAGSAKCSVTSSECTINGHLKVK